MDIGPVSFAPNPSRRQFTARDAEEGRTFPLYREVKNLLSGYAALPLDEVHTNGESNEWLEGKDGGEDEGRSLECSGPSGTSLGSQELEPSEVEEILEYNRRSLCDTHEQRPAPPSSHSPSAGLSNTNGELSGGSAAGVGANSGPHVVTRTHKSSLLSGFWACLSPVVSLWRKDK